MIADRTTLDFDHYEPNHKLKALRAHQALQERADVERVVVHISSGGRGLHLTAHHTRVLTDEERYELRRSLNDDDKRTDLDIERGRYDHAGDIFWTEKDGNEGEREEMPDIWSALARLDATRADMDERVKALALHGRKAVWDTYGPNPAMVTEEV